MILTIAGILAVLFPVITVIGLLISSIGSVITGISAVGSAIGFLFSPIGLIVLAIAGLIAVFVYLWNTNEEFKTKVLEIWGFIKNWFSKVFEDIKVIISVFIKVAQDLWDKWGDKIISLVMRAFNFVMDLIKSALNIVSGIIKVFKGVLTGDWSAIWEGIKQIVSGIWDAVKSIIGKGVDLIRDIIKTGFGIVKDIIGKIFGGFLDLMKAPFNKAKDFIAGIIDWIKEKFQGFKLKFPDIKMPHFSITGKFSLDPPQIPKIGVDWYAKGGLFTDASVIGVGEAGNEAVLPLTNPRTMGMIGSAIASYLPDNLGGSNGDIVVNIYNPVVKDEMDIKRLSEQVSRELFKAKDRGRRAKGRNISFE